MGARSAECLRRRIGVMSTSLAKERDGTMHSSATSPSPGDSRSRVLPFVVWLGFVVGFVVALIAIARPRWFPILDLAQTEMRLRDVFTAHPPLIGLPGRIGTFAHQGSHPGPLSFWALAPLYRLYGSSAWAMQAATATLNAIALGVTLLIARRRGGVTLLAGVGAVLAILTWFYGPSVLTQAWNPYLPMTWFIVFIVGAWSVLCDDVAVLPVTAFAACFCLQTHISYVGMVGGLSALVIAWLVWSGWRRPGALGARPWRWVLITVGVVLVAWIPPVWQELRNEPGNLTLIWNHFTKPPEVAIGLRRGLDVFLVHLNPWRLLVSQDSTTGAVWPGALMLGAWAAGVVVAVRARVRPLIALDVVVATALVLGLASVGNIFGFVWYYLMFWAWILNAFVIFTTVWAVALWWQPRRGSHAPARWAAPAVCGVVIVGYLFGFTLDAAVAVPPTPRVSATLGQLVRPTIAAINRGSVPGGGRAGRYQVTIVDTVTINAPGYGMVSELERAGIHAGFPDIPAYRAIVRDTRIVPRTDATAVVHYAVGPDIAVWRAKAGAVEVARVDPRSARERREAQVLTVRIKSELRDAGLRAVATEVDVNLFAATFDTRVPAGVQRRMLRLLDLGLPQAVFIGPARLAE